MARCPDLNALAELIGPRFAQVAAEHDASGAFVADNYAVLKDHRVFSALIPVELGGSGAPYSAMCALLRRLAQYCPATALALAMHQHLVAGALYNHRQGRPGRTLLEQVAAAELVLISTGANDGMESNGRVETAPDGYRVTARKPFGSGSPKGDVLVTSAPFEDPQEGWQVLHFTVPFVASGVSLADDWHALGMRGTGSHTVVLENVFVPEEAIVLRRPRGQFHPSWNVSVTVAMPLVMSVYAGVAESAVVVAHGLANNRQKDPSVPYLLGELANHLTTMQLAVDDMVRLANDLDIVASLDLTNTLLIRKTIAAEHALATVEKALEAAALGSTARRSLNGCYGTCTPHSSILCPPNANNGSPAAWLSASTQSRTEHKDSARATYIMRAASRYRARPLSTAMTKDGAGPSALALPVQNGMDGRLGRRAVGAQLH
jgi:alkylation response protein AidB-like acyl-CoA dehydrogenase